MGGFVPMQNTKLSDSVYIRKVPICSSFLLSRETLGLFLFFFK